MKKKSQRFQPVVDVAEQQEQQQAKRLGEAQRFLQEEQDKLSQLQQYREEYRQRLDTHSSAGMDILRLRDYHAFLGRLNQAIDEQTRAVQQARRNCEQQRQHWLDRRSRSQALDKVADKYRSEEKRVEQRREQHLTDEHAGRRRRSHKPE